MIASEVAPRQVETGGTHVDLDVGVLDDVGQILSRRCNKISDRFCHLVLKHC